LIRLFTSSFHCESDVRRKEYARALNNNLECSSIDELLIFDESGPELPENSKIVVRPIDRRPMYADYIAWINEVASSSDVSIVANADIFFDRQLELFNRWTLPSNVVLALSRWDIDDIGPPRLHDHNDSQDSWIFRGRVRQFISDYPVGVPRCDNRIVNELERAGYQVLNPAFSIQSYHVHSGERVAYRGGHHAGYVPPPYGYVWPTNLWSLHTTAAYNTRHRAEALRWRLDRRKWSSRLKLHLLRKATSILRRTSRPAAGTD
jgi:hypothetical protein